MQLTHGKKQMFIKQDKDKKIKAWGVANDSFIVTDTTTVEQVEDYCTDKNIELKKVQE